MTSVAKRELPAMRAAGWEVIEYGPWVRLRAAVRMLAHSRRRSGREPVVHMPSTDGGRFRWEHDFG